MTDKLCADTKWNSNFRREVEDKLIENTVIDSKKLLKLLNINARFFQIKILENKNENNPTLIIRTWKKD